MTGELAELDARADALEQSAREREGMLRFAIGELVFDRGRGAGDPVDLDYQIGELAARLRGLRDELAAQLAAVDDRALSLGAVEASGRAGLEALYDPLAHRIDALVPAYADRPAVAHLLAELRAVRRAAAE